MAPTSIPSVDRRDYCIRICGIDPTAALVVLRNLIYEFGKTYKVPPELRIQLVGTAILVRFYVSCHPVFVDEVTFGLMNTLCPTINEGLLEAFEPSLLEATA